MGERSSERRGMGLGRLLRGFNLRAGVGGISDNADAVDTRAMFNQEDHVSMLEFGKGGEFITIERNLIEKSGLK